MSGILKKDSAFIGLIIAVFAVSAPFFYLHQGLMLIDTGREFYIPSQMLKGGILYKDIYNIYGALSYQFNAVLLGLFGQKLYVLYTAGLACSLLIVIACYLLSREFLSRNLSCLLSVLIIFALVFRPFLYNSVLTYAFAAVYALSAFLLSVLFLVKYLKTDNKYMAYLSCLSAGISIANKYEFTLYIFLLFFAILSVKPIGKSGLAKSFSAFILAPLLSMGSLIFQGLDFNDMHKTFILTQNLINAPLLKLFFSHFGAFFDLKGIMLLVLTNKIFAVFAVLPCLNIVMLIHQIKDIYKNKPVFIFILCSISACAKNLFYLNVNHMGVFIFPICAIASVILLKKYARRLLPVILCASIIIFVSDDFSELKHKNYRLETNKGYIYTYKKDGMPVKYASDFILRSTAGNDKVVIMPEGSFINYITDRKGDNFYYNLSPLFYTDVFKEKNVISHFMKNKPDYFIILPIDNSEYGSAFFGADYAQNFYALIVNNYDLIKEENNIKIFKRKKI